MKFRASFCDPFSPDIVELGDISQDEIINKFENINWRDYLERMQNVKENEIHYSPSFEVENKETRHGLDISAVGDPSTYEFYVFYRRPKKVKVLFGLTERRSQNYITEITGQTKDDVLKCLDALIKDDTEYLSNKIGY